PYPEPERLGLMTTLARNNGHEYLDTSQNGAMFEEVRDRIESLDVAAWSMTSGVNFAGEGRLGVVKQQRGSAGSFRVLGVARAFGREFGRGGDTAGGPPLVILSYGFWQRVFRADPAVLGRPITLRGEPYTIVGILPRDFRAASPVDVWTPLRPSRTGEGSG